MSAPNPPEPTLLEQVTEEIGGKIGGKIGGRCHRSLQAALDKLGLELVRKP